MIEFIRVTKLTPSKGGCAGRARYISDRKRQENVYVKSENFVKWFEYDNFEATEVRRKPQAYKIIFNEETKEKEKILVDVEPCVGREYIVAFPNEMIPKICCGEILRKDLGEFIEQKLIPVILKTQKTERTGKLPEYEYAVHLNRKGHIRNMNDIKRGGISLEYHKEDNLHVHIIHSERLRQPSTGTWTRDIYFTDTGIQARNKNERAKDENGNDLPPIHRKGEPKGCFSLKDPEYASGKWLADTKAAVKEMFEDLGYSYEPRKYFPRAKEGKGKTHDKNGNLTRYGRIKQEHELFEKAEKEMAFYKEMLNYTFPDNTKINGQHTIGFENLRKHLITSLHTGDSLHYIFGCHGKRKPKVLSPAPIPEPISIPEPSPAIIFTPPDFTQKN